MRNPIKIPKVTDDGRSYTTLKHFLLSLLATTISIVLTFGTSAFIEKREKEAAKREMVMMIIYDFDKTIEKLQHADTVFHQASIVQQTLAIHPEYFDSLRFKFMPAIMVSQQISPKQQKRFSLPVSRPSAPSVMSFLYKRFPLSTICVKITKKEYWINLRRL